MKKNIIILLISIYSMPAFADSMFDQGEDLLMKNQLSDAVLMFEASLEQDRTNAKTYLYLGYIYEIKQDYNSAVRVLSQGAVDASSMKEQIYFNLGNNYFKLADYNNAAAMYSKALQSKNGFAEPYLNRANCRVKTAEYSLAVRDYNLYLSLKPDDPQRPQIERMISTLQGSIADEEQRKKEEEQRRLAEQARQKALLDSVLNSLNNAGSDTTNLSAESESVEDIEIDLDIED